MRNLILFSVIFLSTAIKTMGQEIKTIDIHIDFPKLNSKDALFINSLDSVVSQDYKGSKRSRKHIFVIDIFKDSLDCFGVNVTLLPPEIVNDSISNIGFYKIGETLFSVRGNNWQELFCLTDLTVPFSYKKYFTIYNGKETPAPRPPEEFPIWKFRYVNRKLFLIGTENI